MIRVVISGGPGNNDIPVFVLTIFPLLYILSQKPRGVIYKNSDDFGPNARKGIVFGESFYRNT